jgi:hypothetical protein
MNQKSLFIVVGLAAAVVIVSVIAVMNSLDKTKAYSNIMNSDQALQDLKNGKISILEYCSHGYSVDTCNDYKNEHGIK